ncbi:MAG: formate dehydrogenase accessory sulfurtransferase FdhD [Planctomycetaceae bacterium]|nr:formate dehydrogenase accessory sulfurtransferase FdhD [Planctomycetaceae bacterium]
MALQNKEFEIAKFHREQVVRFSDSIATEEPLEIRVVFGPAGRRRSKNLSITMRTPGNDPELAAGFLLSEGIVQSPCDVIGFESDGAIPPDADVGNTIFVELSKTAQFDPEKFQRHFYATSSCGVCGKASLETLRNQNVSPITESVKVERELIFQLPELLRKQQGVFEVTGGLHASGLFDLEGKLVAVREDVGRHNAVDKLIGSQFLTKAGQTARLSLDGHLLVVSGRASFELMQKAVVARIPVLVAVGAPSSLAVELAREFNMVLIGFTSGERFNVYAGDDQIS